MYAWPTIAGRRADRSRHLGNRAPKPPVYRLELPPELAAQVEELEVKVGKPIHSVAIDMRRAIAWGFVARGIGELVHSPDGQPLLLIPFTEEPAAS